MKSHIQVLVGTVNIFYPTPYTDFQMAKDRQQTSSPSAFEKLANLCEKVLKQYPEPQSSCNWKASLDDL